MKLFLILFIISNLWYFLNANVLFPLDVIIIAVYSCFTGYFLIYNAINKRVLHREKIINEIDFKFQEEKKNLYEFLRKFFHFFVFGGTFLFMIVFELVIREIQEVEPELVEGIINPLWEKIPLISEINTEITYDPLFIIFGRYQLLFSTFYMLILPFVIIIEYFRLNPRLGVPLQKLLKKSMRESEINHIGDYYFFFFGLFVSTIFVPIVCVFGMLCVLCFGDTFASLIGKRFGNHKIRWESEKSWEGTYAGTFFTFITSFFFVGWILAIVLGVIFAVIDVITPKRLKMSDNFLYPLVCTLVLMIILLFGVQIDSLVANYFS